MHVQLIHVMEMELVFILQTILHVMMDFTATELILVVQVLAQSMQVLYK